MKQKLFEELKKIGYPVFLQGSLNSDAAYPDNFITFFTDDTQDGAHYDDQTSAFVWYFAVIFYSNDPEILNSKPAEITQVLKQAGFIPQGKGRDIPSDEPTHTGWAMDFIYIEYERRN